ncbi:DUF2087 domain-containing protein [Piscinibacter sakaiensis]|uniref:DUF2087 domain-containing protein n=1 Tax=Piscinibacter sakaiensis TaxID=1547922 RepID=UPI00372631CE
MRWPSRYATQRLALWGLWARFDPERRYREAEVNAVLNDLHLFGDHCTLRRELVNMKLLWRSDGGAEYRRVPAEPDAEARALLGRLAGRRRPGRRGTAPAPGHLDDPGPSEAVNGPGAAERACGDQLLQGARKCSR